MPCHGPPACGTPAVWNASDQAGQAPLHWGNDARDHCRSVPCPSRADLECFLAFLQMRKLENGRSILRLFHPPTRYLSGWIGMNLQAFSQGRAVGLENRGWRRAWHGRQVETLYSILYNGQLFASHGAQGEQGWKGVGMESTPSQIHAPERRRTAPAGSTYVRTEFSGPPCGKLATILGESERQ